MGMGPSRWEAARYVRARKWKKCRSWKPDKIVAKRDRVCSLLITTSSVTPSLDHAVFAHPLKIPRVRNPGHLVRLHQNSLLRVRDTADSLYAGQSSNQASRAVLATYL